MPTPTEFTEPSPLEARLVTKTSLPTPKKAIALLILLWYASGKPDIVEYGSISANQKDGGILDEETVAVIARYAADQGDEVASLSIGDILKKNPLFESQIEALNSAFELVWHLASFSFVNPGLNRIAERKDGIRYRKRIKYSTNLDLIDVIGADNQKALSGVLFSWLSDGLMAGDKDVEQNLVRTLAVFAEPSLFKTSKGSGGKVFTPSGIYDALLDGCDAVDIVDPGEEIQGTTRILKPAIESGLNPMLKGDGGKVIRADGINNETLRNYSNRAKVGISLSSVKVNISSSTGSNADQEKADTLDEPHNWIYFGAPGTGKSYELQEKAVAHFEKDHTRRVTFYPDYTYSQFVGCYKPITVQKPQKEDDPVGKVEMTVTYNFVPGPFLETYIAAVQNPKKNYLLIIEEINRANPAAVFGDIFQLLDRDEIGRSVYEVSVPHEMKDYFKVRLPEYANNAHIADPKELVSEQVRLIAEANRISLPQNMYIWATMNNADQGVFPMDTAFKRRWDFRYLGIDNSEVVVKDKKIPITDAGETVDVFWNDLRHSINKLLLEQAGVNEDKLLGPFFIAPSALADREKLKNTFKDKVLLYLFEDAGRMKRKYLFSRENTTYSQVCIDFDTKGTAVFAEAFEPVPRVGSDLVEESENEQNNSDKA